MKQNFKIILASSSIYRKSMLERLNLSFEVVQPNIDETAKDDESPSQLVMRLSCEKAKKIGESHANALVIGSDQVACLGSQVLCKPGNRDNAIKQLQLMSGNSITFFTGLCLFNSVSKESQIDTIPYEVSFRVLSVDEINRYLDIDKPYDCAGSFKSEKTGITLIKSMNGNDPTALMGLPLIRLSEMLRNAGAVFP
ncbi:MAG: Maf family protein [Gammaproteobacteria bacterium]|jgi:septum formation protein